MVAWHTVDSLALRPRCFTGIAATKAAVPPALAYRLSVRIRPRPAAISVAISNKAVAGPIAPCSPVVARRRL